MKKGGRQGRIESVSPSTFWSGANKGPGEGGLTEPFQNANGEAIVVLITRFLSSVSVCVRRQGSGTGG